MVHRIGRIYPEFCFLKPRDKPRSQVHGGGGRGSGAGGARAKVGGQRSAAPTTGRRQIRSPRLAGVTGDGLGR
uniref:Uncharacterized protein n=1 Tax=Oryza rufipogon TaxID=4529 RepID=A0A0E0PDA7_ORYRU